MSINVPKYATGADSPLMKLSILTSENLPTSIDRSQSKIYFVYDKMELYVGKGRYTDAFYIVESMPSNSVEGALYILMDGTVRTRIDMVDVYLAEAEDTTELPLLKLAGTTYFQQAETRYLDLQTETINLPFQNGNFQLSVSLGKDIKIDKNTIISYDETSGTFKIDGTLPNTDTSGLLEISKYKGSNSTSIATTITDETIKSNIIVSPDNGNALEVLSNGLFVPESAVTAEEFEQLEATYNAYEKYVDAYIAEIKASLTTIDAYASEEAINQKILDALESYKPTITTVLENYDIIAAQLGLWKEAAKDYTDTEVGTLRTDIETYLTEMSSRWSTSSGAAATDNWINYTDSEKQIIANYLAQAYTEILLARSESGGAEVLDFDYYLVTDNNALDDASTYQVYPEQLTVESVMSATTGYTHLFVTPSITSGDLYYYKATTTLPIYGSNAITESYTALPSTQEIKVDNGTKMILVETDSTGKILKYGEFTAVTRTTNVEQLAVLNIVPTESATENYINLSVTPSITSGNIYMIRSASSIPNYNEILPTDYVIWDGSSSISLDTYNQSTLCVVECDSTYHRAKKIGLVYIDKANETIGTLTLTSTAGNKTFHTIVSVDPTVNTGNIYYYRFSNDTVLPILNTVISPSVWTAWNGTDEITINTDYTYLLLAETTTDRKVKRVGSVKPTMNILLSTAVLETTDTQNITKVTVSDLVGSLYYANYLTEDAAQILTYGSTINTSTYTLLSGSTVTTLSNGYIELVEVVNNTVRRYGIYNVPVSYAGALTITSVAGSTTGKTKLTVSPTLTTGDLYYYKTLTEADNSKIESYTVLDTSSCTAWNGTSDITTTSGAILKLYEVNTSFQIINSGSVTAVIK